MVHAQTLDFVQRNEHPGEKKLVLFLQWESEAIDNGTKNFEQFGDAVEALRFVYELEEDIVDGAANVRAKVEEFAIYAMERGFQKIAFSGIFRVEQLK